MEKIDYKKELKEFYSAKSEPKIVKVSNLKYITAAGEGNPNTSESFKRCTEALFGIAYTIKFMIKKGETSLDPIDFTVMPLEGQWWAEDMETFLTRDKDSWKWKIMILMPEFVTEKIFSDAKEKLKIKKNPIALSSVAFEKIEDGLSAQIMHIGPFDNEGPTIEKLHKFIEESGYKIKGFHREIYLSDFRKAAPEKLKTIIRQQMS